MIRRVTPVFDVRLRAICCRPYSGHKKGCPNFGVRQDCPPRAPLVTRVLNLAKPVYAVWNRFDLEAHVGRMRERHPDWTQRQLECCLYWQGTARKELRALVAKAQRRHLGLLVLYTPEACGVNVTETMRQIGIELEWPPVKYVRQVALMGSARR